MVKVAKSRVADRNIGLSAFQRCYSLDVALNIGCRLAVFCSEKKIRHVLVGGSIPLIPLGSRVTTLSFQGHVTSWITRPFNSRAMCYCLLVVHLNRASISNRFRDIQPQKTRTHRHTDRQTALGACLSNMKYLANHYLTLAPRKS